MDNLRDASIHFLSFSHGETFLTNILCHFGFFDDALNVRKDVGPMQRVEILITFPFTAGKRFESGGRVAKFIHFGWLKVIGTAPEWSINIWIGRRSTLDKTGFRG